MSNMKQLALSVLMYVQDYDSRLPPRDNDDNPFNRMEPYMKNTQMVRCPSGYSYKTGDSVTSRNYPLYGFAANGTGGAQDRYICALVAVKDAYSAGGTPRFSLPMGIDDFPVSSLTCLFGETRYPLDTQYTRDGYGGALFYASADLTGYYGKFLERERHFDGSNYAYVDGHVKWIKHDVVKRVYQAQWDNGGTGSTAQYLRGIREDQAGDFPIVFAWKCPGPTSGGGWSNNCY